MAIFQKTGLYIVVTSTDAKVTGVGSCLPHLTSHHCHRAHSFYLSATNTEQAMADKQRLFVELN